MFLKNTYENLNDINYKPWLLFNENQLFKKNFPKKFIKTLDNINLINYFDRNKLTNLWNKYSIKNWIEKINIDNHKALSTIYSIN